MLVETIKTEKFAVAFSALLGFAIIAIAIPACKGDDCVIKKAPSPSEMKSTTWRLERKCYQFRPESVSCPAEGVIEAFSGCQRK
jgi:hypothetical protein